MDAREHSVLRTRGERPQRRVGGGQLEFGEDHPVAAYLVGNLDDQGFLGCSVQAAATQLGVSPGRVERVLKVLQHTAPAGVGARDLRLAF